MNKITFHSIILILFAIALAGCAHGKTYQQKGHAVSGYDTVAYFTEGQPVQGNVNYSSKYNGATWLFSSAENKQLFDSDPEKYAPQYGGYCAYAMANGFNVSSDPQAWEIYNDRLYLNYSLSVRERWSKNKDDYIQRADHNWESKKAE